MPRPSFYAIVDSVGCARLVLGGFEVANDHEKQLHV